MKKIIFLALIVFCAGALAENTLVIDNLSFSYTAKMKDLNAGFFDFPGQNQLTITATTPWQLYVLTDAPVFSATGSYHKPVGDLQWRRKSQGAYHPLTLSPQLVAEGQVGTAKVMVEYRLLLSWLNPPDTYTVTLIYTLTSEGAP